MIDARELRIGNWISGKNDPYMKVVSINVSGDVELRFNGVDSDYGDWHYEEGDLHGIPLSTEILVVAGFSRDGNHWYHRNLSLPVQKTISGGEMVLVPNPLYCLSIEFVHQLQNLYYSLTGQELVIKELT